MDRCVFRARCVIRKRVELQDLQNKVGAKHNGATARVLLTAISSVSLLDHIRKLSKSPASSSTFQAARCARVSIVADGDLGDTCHFLQVIRGPDSRDPAILGRCDHAGSSFQLRAARCRRRPPGAGIAATSGSRVTVPRRALRPDGGKRQLLGEHFNIATDPGLAEMRRYRVPDYSPLTEATGKLGTWRERVKSRRAGLFGRSILSRLARRQGLRARRARGLAAVSDP
jgi:hypothetical protein